jgi:hypothetical protein
MQQEEEIRYNAAFWFHLSLVLIGLSGWFLISWWVMTIVYSIVLLQFVAFNRCLLNAQHALKDKDDTTFYSFLLEKIGVAIPRKPLKKFVRFYLYPVLSLMAFFWQSSAYGLGIEPLFF